MDPISSAPAHAPLPFDATGLRLVAGGGLSQQIHAQLKAKILQGELQAGAQLPTSRDLARALGVSRNTVVRAYEQLSSEGCLLTRLGAGCFVAAIEGLPQATAAKSSGASQRQQPPAASEPSTPLWQRLQDYEPTPVAPPTPRAFRYGLPALDLFPHALWSRLQARFWRRQARGLRQGAPEHELASLSYSEAAGLPRLRELIASYLSHSRGLPCSAERVIVTAGSQQAIAMAALALLQPGDRVGMESPGYRAAAAALGLSGATVLPVPVDEQGLRVGALEALGRAGSTQALKLLYITPSHQYPTGVAMPLQRRLDLLDWAERHQAWLLEDDYDGEYSFSGLPLAPLSALDARAQQRTLYIGSFSKLLFPGLRLGYLVAPKAWVPKLARLRSMLDRQSSIADQVVMADFMAEGHFLRHVRRMRRGARQRRDALMQAWSQLLLPQLPPAWAALLKLQPVDAGLQAYLPLPSRAMEVQLHRAALAAGIEIGSLAQVGGLPAHSALAGLTLGFATVGPAEIRRATQALGRAWRPVLLAAHPPVEMGA